MTSTDPDGPRPATGADPAAPQRHTRQRDAIRSAMASGGFRTAQDVHDALRRAGASIGLATVYRALQAMAEAGEVDALRTPDGITAYRRCSPAHHHHLICRACGRTIEIEAAPLEQWAEQIAAQYGFRDIGHVVEIDGLCPDCCSDPARQ